MKSALTQRESISKKAKGSDGVLTRILRETAKEITEVVCFLINQSYNYNSGQSPRDWCSANIVPIFKKGLKHDPNNCWPVLCKVMEHVVYQSIMQHLEYNNILYT